MENVANYRDFLKSILAERISSNPNYSLRAFARDIEVPAPHLCSVLKGKKNLSTKSAVKVAAKLKLSQKNTEYFVRLLSYTLEKTIEGKEYILCELKKLKTNFNLVDLSLENFKAISEWYHIPIIEMISLSHISITPKNIGKRLGINPLLAADALKRLEKIGLIKKYGETYKKTHPHAQFKSQNKNLALQKYHKSMLEKAIASLKTQNNEEKYVGSRTFAISQKRLPEAFEITRRYLNEMSEFFDGKEEKNHVYHLNVQLFNLTQN